VFEDANAEVERAIVHQPTIGRYSLHDSRNENGLQSRGFTSYTNESTSKPGTHQTAAPATRSIPVNRRATLLRREGAERCEYRFRSHLCGHKIEAQNKPSKQHDVTIANAGNVATVYHHELEAELPGASEPGSLSLDNKWKRKEEAVRKGATNTIGYTQNQAEKVWFDEECEKVNGEPTKGGASKGGPEYENGVYRRRYYSSAYIYWATIVRKTKLLKLKEIYLLS
jgi:hypothetical protein